MEDPEYFVCNPATDKIWAVLQLLICVCFDPAAPSRFVVFKFIQEGHRIMAAKDLLIRYRRMDIHNERSPYCAIWC